MVFPNTEASSVIGGFSTQTREVCHDNAFFIIPGIKKHIMTREKNGSIIFGIPCFHEIEPVIYPPGKEGEYVRILIISQPELNTGNSGMLQILRKWEKILYIFINIPFHSETGGDELS